MELITIQVLIFSGQSVLQLLRYASSLSSVFTYVKQENLMNKSRYLQVQSSETLNPLAMQASKQATLVKLSKEISLSYQTH